jgi:DNA-binding IscR family transcriptional regulator
VIEATEGRTFEVNCADHPVDPERCQTHASCSLRPLWWALQSRIDELLAQVHLADLLREEDAVRDLLEPTAAASHGIGAPAGNVHAGRGS